jgi:tetratricopeptide (TPR) repeat protein
MNEQATILLNISSSFSGINAGKAELSASPSCLQYSIQAAFSRSFYRRERFELLGRQLATIAHHAYFTRQTEAMKEASQLMLALPLSKDLKSAAHYYQAISAWKQGQVNEARQMLNRTVNAASPAYQARGLLSIGATFFGQGEFEAALPYYVAAVEVAGNHDLQTFVTAQRMIAVVRSIYGDHHRALNDLERLSPIVCIIARRCPPLYYDFLNSYAVELGEVGRIPEAQKVCAVTLASSFASIYPELAQTRAELDAKRTAATPSIIAVPAALEVAPAAQAEVAAVPEPARACFAVSFDLTWFYSLTMTLLDGVFLTVSLCMILDRLADSILPRGPPTVS